MSEPGHVFVVHTDLTKLACDYYLIPTDAALDVGPHWSGKFGLPPSGRPSAWASDGGRVTHARQIAHQPDGKSSATVRWVNTGSVPQKAKVDWLEAGVREALLIARSDLHQATIPRNDRARPLVAMPVFGTGAGGFDGQRGKVLDMLLRLTNELVRDACFDLVVVCHERADYAALQSRPQRLDVSETTLSADQMNAADRLGNLVRDGRLVLFLGAGVSIPAGLPTWPALLHQLGTDTEGYDDQKSYAADADLPAIATALRAALGEGFDEALRKILERDEYALGHALLAALRVNEVITTNFDDLYEQVAEVTFAPRTLRTLPWALATPGDPWLLKLHGGIGHPGVILSSEDFDNYDHQWKPLASIVQALLMTRHMLFVGYSLTDANFVRLGKGVSKMLAETGAAAGGLAQNQVGTVLTLQPDEELTEEWDPEFAVVAASDDRNRTPTSIARAGRQLEIFLDRIAAKAASDEHSFVLDRRYAELLTDPSDRLVAEQLMELAGQLPDSHPAWRKVKTLFESYGASRR